MEFLAEYWPVILPAAAAIVSEIVGISKAESNSILQLVGRIVLRKKF